MAEEGEGEGEESEEEPLDDLMITDIDLVFNEETQSKPFVGGFIMVGYPQTGEQIEKFKEEGLDFDKIIFLSDDPEAEEPGNLFIERNKNNDLYDHEAATEEAQQILDLYNEHFDEKVFQVNCSGTEAEVLDRVLATLDPFHIQVDNNENIFTTEDLEDKEKDPQIQRGEYGNFCPVTLTNDSWLYPGNVEEHEVQVQERAYCLAGEKELEQFQANPMNYIWEGVQRPPQPHIMFVGPSGSGMHTQMNMISQKFKIDTFYILEAFKKRLDEEKQKRKRDRLLARGFKEPDPEDEGEDGEYPPDPEIEDDPDDFDKEAHEREIFKEILDASKAQFYNGNWFDLPDEEAEIQIATEIIDLMFDSRRPPEAVFYLKVSEKDMLERKFDKQKIQDEYDEGMAALKKK